MLNIDIFLFSLFSLFSLVSAIFVISLNNAVHSVLFLVLTFFNVACLLLLLGAEFFSFLLIIVYVGAIAVLFLFVIMMLNIKLEIKISSFYVLLPIILICLILLFNNMFTLLNNTDLLRFCLTNLEWESWLNEKNVKLNIEVVGLVLYSYYSFLFLSSGLILLVAMIGAIVLTLHTKSNSKAQIIEFQLIRNPKDSVKFLKLRK
uniref:NADH dehydrogenase subunit 6 n=1 Tax=Centroceras gasparrinii TaxID=371099 RepID=UPI002E768AF1|nr:NADH dehydrogenase subunit 6 [Centroceras gasparrinii]WQF69489.1 NADH dehydrogenase subunit 6 [Centroceras gasparrinii]